MEVEVKNYDGQIYIKGDLRKILNTDTLRCLANAKAVVLFSNDVDLTRVKKSIEVILRDIKYRIEDDEEEKINETK